MTMPRDLAQLPKAEVHVHLTSTMRPATLEELSARESVDVPRSFHDLASFLEVLRVAGQTLTSPNDYARLVREYCEDAARVGIHYAELEISTTSRPYDCLGAAVAAAAQQRDVEVRFIVSFQRNLPVEAAWAALEAATAASEVVAVGLAGPEDGHPPEPFAEVFAEARRRGFHAAPHAGEGVGPASVRGALEALKAERIQHGVRAIEDPALVAKLARQRIPLAVCPTSNLRLGVVPSLEEHPLRALWEADILVSVNTDVPGFLECDLVGEYAIAGRLLGLDRAGYGRLALNSIESSFAPDALKAELRGAIEDWTKRG